jgi:hypothetical protein
VEEGLLFNRVTLSSGDISEWHMQDPVFIEANPAYAGRIQRDEAAMAAGEAAQTPVVQRLE